MSLFYYLLFLTVVIQTCGVGQLPLFDLNDEGCTADDDFVFCQCKTDLCNTNDLLTTSGSGNKRSASKKLSWSALVAVITGVAVVSNVMY